MEHKGSLHPPSNRNTRCLLIVDSFSRFLMVYPVITTVAQATNASLEKWIHHFGIPQSIIHDKVTACFNTDFVNWTKVFGIILRARTAHSPWPNGKIETQNQHIARYWRKLLNDAGTNSASLASIFTFAHNTSVNYNTGKTTYEIVFGAKPEILMFAKLGFYGNKQKLCCSEICTDLPPHTHHENSLKKSFFRNYFEHNSLSGSVRLRASF